MDEPTEEKIYEIKHLADDVVKLCRVSLKLVETLQFYANPNNYKLAEEPNENYSIVEVDHGQRARDILKERL